MKMDGGWGGEGVFVFVFFNNDNEQAVRVQEYQPRTGRGCLAFTRYRFTSRLYCTIIFFANTPFIVQYIAQYYQLLHPPAKI